MLNNIFFTWFFFLYFINLSPRTLAPHSIRYMANISPASCQCISIFFYVSLLTYFCASIQPKSIRQKTQSCSNAIPRRSWSNNLLYTKKANEKQKKSIAKRAKHTLTKKTASERNGSVHQIIIILIIIVIVRAVWPSVYLRFTDQSVVVIDSSFHVGEVQYAIIFLVSYSFVLFLYKTFFCVILWWFSFRTTLTIVWMHKFDMCCGVWNK